VKVVGLIIGTGRLRCGIAVAEACAVVKAGARKGGHRSANLVPCRDAAAKALEEHDCGVSLTIAHQIEMASADIDARAFEHVRTFFGDLRWHASITQGS
jgi:hypothetical protein